ncbi:Plasmid stabilization system protein ParE [Reichenbachiella faecimaris]|uniref:Plasmid stabilization system protein ParE n=1 Tax=Reichenbachiella faecimaris TaxID=692418 RepID=A0A1W2GKF0_REIFA|nr:Plasmid stabilization system protein ParE [Reichenbachiella faecimaris]
MKTVWTPLGLKSLDKTTNFIEEQWNEDVVDNFLDQLDERIEQLKRNPRIGPTYGQTEFRQLLIHPLVTLYYELKTDYISLTLVWANKKDPDELREELKRM